MYQHLPSQAPGRSPASTYTIQFLKVWVMEAVDVEPVLRYLGPRTATLGQELPQLLGVVDVTGKTTTHANDGDRGV